jgi:hypothetical protein
VILNLLYPKCRELARIAPNRIARSLIHILKATDLKIHILKATDLKNGDKLTMWLDASHIIMEPSKRRM